MSIFSKSPWNSRQKLTLINIVLIYLYVIIQIWKYGNNFTQMSAMKNESIYDEDVNNALDGMKYMKDLTRGTAYIAPVVAKPQRITEHNGCAKLQVLQVVEMGWIRAENIHLFSAYYDKRLNSMFPRQHVVQVLAMHYRTLEEKLYCTLQSPYTSVVVRAGIREIWQRAWDPRDHFYIPYLISCPVPKRLRNDADIMVTVSTKRCVTGKVSALKVQLNNKNDMKGKIAVCVKGLDFLEDKNYSNHFVEWMELQLLLGADSVTVYTYSVTEEMFQILDFYEKRRKLNHIRLTLPGESPNVALTRSTFIWRNRQQKRRHELIPYNDCLYRHINSHEYLLIVDTDEVVIPLKHASWGQMIASELSTNLTDKVTSISITNVFKFPSAMDSSGNFYMLENRKRSAKSQNKKDYGKSFVKTKNVATVFNHFSLHRQHENVVRTVYLDPEIGIKLHYKEECPIESRKECPELMTNTIDDTSLDRWAEELKTRVNSVRKSIGI